MTITEAMDTLTAAITDAEAHPTSRLRRRRERTVILRLTSLRVLGEQGIPAGVDDAKRPMFGFTLAQCRRMLATIEEAARAEYAALAADDEARD